MIEVEAKVKVLNLNETRKKIESVAKLTSRERKTDDYYTLEKDRYPKKSLRIRKTKDKYQVNFKEKLSYVKGVHAKKETEFEIKEITDFLNLIKDFGFRKWLTKEKHSEIYEIHKNFHIELNNVKHLGWFLEIEYLATPNEIKKAREEILKLMKKLNIKESQIEKSGYTKMLWDEGYVRKQ